MHPSALCQGQAYLSLRYYNRRRLIPTVFKVLAFCEAIICRNQGCDPQHLVCGRHESVWLQVAVTFGAAERGVEQQVQAVAVAAVAVAGLRCTQRLIG